MRGFAALESSGGCESALDAHGSGKSGRNEGLFRHLRQAFEIDVAPFQNLYYTGIKPGASLFLNFFHGLH